VIIDDGGFVDCIDEALHRFRVFQRAPIQVWNRISVRGLGGSIQCRLVTRRVTAAVVQVEGFDRVVLILIHDAGS
jgi:hypothetical protein